MKNTCKYLTLLTAIILMTACGSKEPEGPQQKVEEKPLVKLSTVQERAVPQIQEYTATVEAEVKNNIAPATPIRINEIFVEVGDHVHQGQKLVKMDESNLRQLELQLQNKRTEFERTDELYKIGGVSKSEWDALKMAVDVQQTAYEDLKKNTALLSPIDGIVTARNYDNGDLYSGAQPVLVVEQIQPVKLLIHVSEEHYTQMKEGSPVDIRLDVYGDEKFSGKVSLVYPTIDAATRTFPVEVEVANRDERVRPGMFARATLNFGEKQHVVVPDLAVVKQRGAGDSYVYVYQQGKVSYNKVQLGRRMGNEYELLSGVPNGAQVVIAGQSRLADGVEVMVK